MTQSVEYSFTRYLAAKQGVDDRALNRGVWDALVRAVAGRRALRVLEVGGGIGTMLERLVSWDLLGTAAAAEPASLALTMVDAQAENIAEAQRRIGRWGPALGFQLAEEDGRIMLRRSDLNLSIGLEAADLFEFTARRQGQTWDLLIAHAVLDVLDTPRALRALLPLLASGGLFYFTITFDGVTALEPAIDPAFDALIERLYHACSDERVVDGAPSGDSHAGRHLFRHLRERGAEVLAMGSSDWVVFAGPRGYAGDEAYFLHFIVNTIRTALAGHPALDAERFAAWLDERHAQIERGELLYITHQLDVLGRVRAAAAGQPGAAS